MISATSCPSRVRAGPEARPWGWPVARWHFAAAVLFVLALGQAAWAAWTQGVTTDEPLHLLWSERFWDHGLTERSSNVGFNSKTPIAVGHVLMRRAARAWGASPTVERFLTRLPSVSFLAALLLTVYGVGRACFGAGAGCLALMLAALDPNLVAHGSLVTADVAFAFAATLLIGAELALQRRPTLSRAALMGAVAGLALVTKFSAILLLPGAAGILLLAAPPGANRAARLRWTLAAGLAAAITGGVVLGGAYLFRDLGRPLGALDWRSAPLHATARLTPGLALPLPAAFLEGIDASLADERGEWQAIVFGRVHPHGAWYYFVVHWLLKTPLALLILLIVGLGGGRGQLLRDFGSAWMLAHLALVLLYFSLLFRAQIGYRFVLPCIPLACLLAARGLAARPGPRVWRAGAAGLAALALAEGLTYAGNPLSFTNIAVWPKHRAFRVVVDSNLDWGQNDEHIHELLRKRGLGGSHLNPRHLLPGHNIISVKELSGVRDAERHRWVRDNLEPTEHVEHTHLLFAVDASIYERFLVEQRTLPDASALCGPVAEGEQLQGGARVPMRISGPPQPGQHWVLCVRSRKGSQVGVRGAWGNAAVGAYAPGSGCRLDRLGTGESMWWRVPAGTSALCVDDWPTPVPGKVRDFGAVVRVRGRTVSLSMARAGPLASSLEREPFFGEDGFVLVSKAGRESARTAVTGPLGTPSR